MVPNMYLTYIMGSKNMETIYWTCGGVVNMVKKIVDC